MKKKAKWFLIIFILLAISVSLIHSNIPLSDANYKITEASFKYKDSLWNASQALNISKSLSPENNISLYIKHQLFFSLKDLDVIIFAGYSDRMIYYGKYEYPINVEYDWVNEGLRFVLIDKENNGYSFGGKGSCNEYKNTGLESIEKRTSTVTLYSFQDKNCGSRFSMEIPLAKTEYADFIKDFKPN